MKLQLHDLSLWRRRQPVLAGLNWTLPAGQCWVLLGENGSGKSSLLQALADADRELHFVGGLPQWQDLLQQTPLASRRALARQLQEPVLGLRVSDVLALVCVDVASCARIWGLEAQLQRSLMQLSGGQLQRLELARSWAQIQSGQGLWLLDEPFNHLDMRAQLELCERMQQHCQHGGSVLFSAHDLQHARRWAQGVLMLAAGAQLACGASDLLGDSTLLGQLYGLPQSLAAQLI